MIDSVVPSVFPFSKAKHSIRGSALSQEGQGKRNSCLGEAIPKAKRLVVFGEVVPKANLKRNLPRISLKGFFQGISSLHSPSSWCFRVNHAQLAQDTLNAITPKGLCEHVG